VTADQTVFRLVSVKTKLFRLESALIPLLGFHSTGLARRSRAAMVSARMTFTAAYVEKRQVLLTLNRREPHHPGLLVDSTLKSDPHHPDLQEQISGSAPFCDFVTRRSWPTLQLRVV
jgi:hypothetical protein